MGTLSGQKIVPPLNFVWGTFCRQVLVNEVDSKLENQTKEMSLYGVLPGLDMTIDIRVPQNTAPADMPKDFEVPFVVWAHAVFRMKEVSDKPEKVTISAMVSQPKRDAMVQVFEVPLRAGQEFLQVNMQIQMNGPGGGLLLSEGKTALKASFRYQSVDLGKIELPIKTKVKIVESQAQS